MARRTLRNLPRISYCEPEEPNLDEYIYCEKCGDDVYEYCSIHGGLLVIPDDKVPASPPFPPTVPRAALTIPKVFLHLNYSSIPGAGLGVFATLTLPIGVRFGPYRGKRINDVDSDYCWQIYDRNRKPCHLVDASDSDKSNWMRYVNCARHWSEQNLLAFQYQGELYYRTIKIVPRFSELMVFYGTEYAHKLNIDIKNFNSPKIFARKFGGPPPKKQKLAIGYSKSQNESTLKPSDNKQTNELTTIQNSLKADNPKSSIKKCKPQKEATQTLKSNTDVNSGENTLHTDKYSENIAQSVTKKKKETKIAKETKAKLRKNSKITNKEGIVNSITKSIIEAKPNYINYLKNFDTFKSIDDNNTESQNCNLDPHKNDKHIHLSDKDQNCAIKKIQNTSYRCDVCNYESITKKFLESHMRFHDRSRKFMCQTCNYRFDTSLCLTRHLLKHTQIKTHACHICNYRCSQAITLKRHIRTHTGEKPYSCNICNYKSSDSSNLKNHIRTHTGEKPYSCDICNYRCSHAIALKSHIRTHTGEKPYSCNICNYKSSDSSNLKNHIRTHTGEKPYSCDICNYRCSHAIALKSHIRTHTGEKPYTCDICDYRCSVASALKSHIRTHTGEKPYSCNICNYRSSQASALKSHIRTHTGEKPYSCDICNYRFSVASHLKSHIRTHTGEKPYACDICNYRCSQITSLKLHLKKHLDKGNK